MDLVTPGEDAVGLYFWYNCLKYIYFAGATIICHTSGFLMWDNLGLIVVKENILMLLSE